MPHVPGHTEPGFKVTTKSDEEALKMLQQLAEQYEGIGPQIPTPPESNDKLYDYKDYELARNESRARAKLGQEAYDQFMDDLTVGNVLEATSMIPVVGEVLDFANIPYAYMTGKDMYSGDPMTAKEASAWAVGGLLVPNLFQSVGKRLRNVSRGPAKDYADDFINRLTLIGDEEFGGGSVKDYIPKDIYDQPAEVRTQFADYIEDALKDMEADPEFMMLDPDETSIAFAEMRDLMDGIVKGNKGATAKAVADLKSPAIIGDYHLNTQTLNSNNIDYEFKTSGVVSNNLGIQLYRDAADMPWNMNFRTPPGNTGETMELLQKVTDNIKVGETFKASLSSDSYPLMLRLVDRSENLQFVLDDVPYEKLNAWGRKGAGDLDKGILGLTPQETRDVIDGNVDVKDIQKVVDKVNENLPQSFKDNNLRARIIGGSGGFSVEFPVPTVKRVKERDPARRFGLKEGGYVVKKKRKKGYRVKR